MRTMAASDAAISLTHERAGRHNKRVVSRLVEAISRGNLSVFDEVYTAEAAAKARQWVRPFLSPFPMSGWTSFRWSLMATLSLQGCAVQIPSWCLARASATGSALSGWTRCTCFPSRTG